MAKATSRPGLAAGLPVLLVVTAAGLLAVGLQAGLYAVLLLIIVPAAASALYLVWRVHPAYTLCSAIFLSPLAGNWGELGLPSGVDPDRLLLVVGILQVMLRAPGIRDRPRFRFTVAHAFLALAAVYAVASAYFAGTLYVKVDLFKIVDAFGILPFLVYLTAPVAFRTRRHRGILLVTLVTLGAYLGLTTLFQMTHLDALVFPRYILNPNYGIHATRGRGPFVDAVANGFACFVCAAACGVALASWAGRRARGLAGLIGVLCLAGAFLSLERSVWIGSAAAIAITMLTTRRLRGYLAPVAAVIAISVIAALTLIPSLNATVNRRIDSPTYDRQALAVAGLNMINARPLTGFGWGQFEADSLLYFKQSQNYPLTDENRFGLHNFLLTYAVELGLPGATLWAIGVLTGVGIAMLTRGPPDLEPWRRALFAVVVVFLVVSNTVPPIEFPNLAIWLLAGVVSSGQYARSRPAAVDSAIARGSQPPSGVSTQARVAPAQSPGV